MYTPNKLNFTRLESWKCILVLVGFIMLTSCQQELYKSNNKYNIPEKNSDPALVQFIVEPTNYAAILEIENLAKAYDYSKIPYKTVWVNKFSEKLPIAPTVRVVTIHETASLNDQAVDSLLQFVSKGGTLFITKATRDERMSFFYGMTPDADWSQNNEASGLSFNKPLFPGMQGYAIDNKVIHRGFDSSNFANNVNVLVSSYTNKNYPVLLENRIGNGRVVFYNSSEILKKEMRGLLFASTLIGLEGIPYPIANTATIFLDDFPAPDFKANGDPYRSKLGESKSEFIKEDWWPKMKKMARDNNIKYSSYFVFNSDDKISGEFDFNSWDKSNKTSGITADGTNAWISAELIKAGHELGFKGYNNLPLNNSLWYDTNQMTNAAEASQRKWKETISKNLPISYVAPKNQIDSLGLVSLKKGFPSLNYLHTSFFGNLEQGGNREFDPDPLNERFFDFPRISEGYEISPDEKWAIESTYIYTGIWSHAINNESLFNSGVSNLSFKNFNKVLLDYKKRHPFTRFLTAKAATETTMDWRYQDIKHLSYEGQYEVSSSLNSDAKKPSFWLMYVDQNNSDKLTEQFNNDLVNFEKVPLLNGYLFHIRTSSPSLSVPDIRPSIKNLVNTTSTVTKKMITEYNDYNVTKEKLSPLKEEIDRLVAEDKKAEASNLMENLFDQTKYINANQIDTYANNMIALNKEKQMWQELSKIYSKNPSSANAELAKKVAQTYDYPSKEIKKQWQERQMEWDDTDLELLKDYYNDFNTPENNKVLSQVLETLATLEPNAENTKNYIDFLIDTNDVGLLSTLDAIDLCSLEDKNLSTAISYAYAEKLNFKKALAWTNCSNEIDNSVIAEWQLKSDTIEDQKDVDLPYYIEYLLVNNPEKAMAELEEIPVCNEDLLDLSTYIAVMYGEYAQYKNALDWSECSTGIPIKSKMDWNSEIGDMEQLDRVYTNHMSENPDDFYTMNYMAQLQLLNGKLEDAGKTAMTIPSEKLDPDFKIAFNNVVKNQGEGSKTIYIETFKVLMDDAIVQKSEIEKRKKKGSSIGFTSSALADEFDPTLWSNLFHYGFYNKKGDFHRFSLAQTTAYTIFKDTLIANDEGRDLFGLEYKFSKTSNEKSPYWIGARVELDNNQKLFYHLNSGINLIGENSTTTFEVDGHPVRTGPGYVLDIYDIGLTAEQSFNYSKNLKQSFRIDGSYFTDSQYYGTGRTRIDYNIVNLDKFKFGPLVEGAYSQGSEERRNGFPYWLTEDRLFGGGGVNLQLGNEDSNFFFSSDFALFTEQEEPNFQRYQGNLSYRIKDFTQINLNYRYFTIDRFFANTFQLGIQYNFK